MTKKSANTDAIAEATPAVKTPKVEKEKVEKVPGKRGRRIDNESERQKRLARFEEMRSRGEYVGRGRRKGSKEKPKG